MASEATIDTLTARIAAHFKAQGREEPTVRGGQNATTSGFTIGIKVQGDDGYTLFHGETAQEVLDQIKQAY